MTIKPSAIPSESESAGERRRTFRPTAANAGFKFTPRFKIGAGSGGKRSFDRSKDDTACPAPRPVTGRPSTRPDLN